MARAAARAGADILVRAQLHRRPAGLLARALLRPCARDREPDVRHQRRHGGLAAAGAGGVAQLRQASILTPSDFPFARDGILAEGNVNQEMMVIGDLNLNTIRHSREEGTVLPLLDSERTSDWSPTRSTVML